MSFKQRFIQNVKNEGLIQKSDRVLLALSGGKDSVCLFFLLLDYKKLSDFEFGCCHVHHGIRGSEADQDLLFCKTLCEQHGIPFYEKRVSAPEFCKKEKLGLEEGARILRYRALSEVAEKHSYQKIATAHTASDQAETILFRLIRGSGLGGLCGIKQKNGMLIRPLLPFTSEEILSLLEKESQRFILDSSNDDILFSRNRIRHCILPEMKRIQPKAEKSICQFSKMAEWEIALCDNLCNLVEKKHNFSFFANSVPLSVLSEMAQDPAGYPVLHRALSRMANDNFSIDFERFSALISLLLNPSSGKIIEIQKGFAFRIQNGRLCTITNEAERKHIDYNVTLCEGQTSIPFLSKTLTKYSPVAGSAKNEDKSSFTIHLAQDHICGTLYARNYISGDEIQMNQMTKSVKKMLTDGKISASERDRIPFVCDEIGILWIPGFGLCDRVRPENAKQHITLTLRDDEV